MGGNSFGKVFTITSFGESHGTCIGVVIDGCPSGLKIDYSFIKLKLSQRRPGQSPITSARNETDDFEIVSGLLDDITTGAPICILIQNKDANSADYKQNEHVYRPSHADFTYQQKYGIRDHKGGGRSSARETAVRVAAGAIAQLLLKSVGIEIHCYTHSVFDIEVKKHPEEQELSSIYTNDVRCPEAETAKKMASMIAEIKSKGDTVGGIIQTIVKNVPIGMGEPVYDKLHADLGKAMLSINACKGFEIGSGFAGTQMLGSTHNDPFIISENTIETKTNHSGGIQGGISNGMDILFKTAFKPVSTIMLPQNTVNKAGEETTLTNVGRHDPCVVPRAVPIVEAMTALVLVDHLLRSRMSKM